ncbi:MAG: MATE family efflux transporter [Patescibacteria group bacterium]
MKYNNDLVTKPIPGLIKKIAVPASIGFFFNTMYNVVDTYYAGLISTQAIAALSLSFPVFFVIIAMGSGISTGATALIANSLGAGDNKTAVQYARQAISFALIIGLILTMVGLFFAPSLFKILGAEGEYLDIALNYINIIFFGTILFLLTFILNSTLTAQGNTTTFRNFLILGFLLNVILDPWLMFGGFGLPALGLAGVAWATVIIQILGIFYIGYRVGKTGMFCSGCLKKFIPKWSYFLRLAKQGVPASLNMMTVAIGIFVITYFISSFGKVAVAAYGIGARIDQIALLPIIGINVATLTLVGQNNGAKRYDRVKEVIKFVIKYALIIVSFGMLGVLLFSKQLLMLFSSDPEVILIGSIYLKISIFVYWAYALLFITVSALQGIKKPFYAIYIGLYRQIAAPLVIFYLLVNVLGWGITGIWWGILIINWSAVIITLIYLKYVMNKLVKT